VCVCVCLCVCVCVLSSHCKAHLTFSSPQKNYDRLIDQHYYAIASKATILPAKDIPVPTDQFRDFFGESWEIALKENRAVNAMDACKRFNCDAAELDAAWGKSKKVVKFGGGFYCGLVSMNGKDLYVFNAVSRH